MTVIENLELDCLEWETYVEPAGFQRMRPQRDGLMPVSSDRSRRQGYCRSLGRAGRKPHFKRS